MIRIMLVEPMNLLRGALSAVLPRGQELEVVAAVGRLDQTIPMARAVKPDVAVFNMDLLADDGITTTSRLKTELPGCAVLVLFANQAPGALRAALDAHVDG